MIVVDTNIIGSLYLSSERSNEAEQALKKDPEWVAPLLWRSEFRNVLSLYIRKKLFSMEEALRIMEEAEILMRGNEFEINSAKTLNLIQTSSCSAYDCEFVALAQDLEAALVTVDKKIIREFPGYAVALKDFVKHV